jgi:hypothetical protein
LVYQRDILRLRVRAALRADAERAARGREADAAPPRLPPFLYDLELLVLPRPDPDFFPPPSLLFTVAHARLSASRAGTPRFL